MSASTTPTLRPCLAIASARLTVTEDLPTPPLPLAIANTFVRLPGWPERCSEVITPSWRSTPVTPGTRVTAAVTSRLIVSLRGQPATVSSTVRWTTPSASISTESTMPSSVIGRLISGSLTVASAALTCSREAVLMIPHRRRWGVGLRRRLRLVLERASALLEIAEQRAQLGAEEVAGGHLADEELHVGVGPAVRLAVLLGDHLVPGLLAVLREQDQRGGVRRLQAQHQGQEDERVVVEPQVLRRQQVPADPDEHEGGHVDQEPGGAHEPRELLGEDAERVGVVRRPAHQRPPGLLGRVQPVAGGAGLSHGSSSDGRHPAGAPARASSPGACGRAGRRR